MESYKATIAISFKKPADRRLVSQFLSSCGYHVVELAKPSKELAIDLILIDVFAANTFGSSFLGQLKDNDGVFLPVIIAIDSAINPNKLLKSNVIDDCLRLPLTKTELESRIKVFLRVREQAQALAERNQEIRAIVESSEDHIFMLDERGYFVSSNGKIKRFLKTLSTDIIGKSLEDVFPSYISNLFRDSLEKSIQTNQSQNFSFILFQNERELHHYVTMFPINMPGGKVRVGGICRDITKLIEAEQQRFLLASSMEHTVEGIIITDANRNILVVNKGFEKMSGYNGKELIGCNLEVLHSKNDGISEFKAIFDIVSSGSPWKGELLTKRQDKKEFIADVAISPILDSQKNISHFVAVYRDVTEERQFEKIKQQFMRLEAIGTLAGGIAHDFNNILVPIMGFAELSRSSVQPGSKLESYLDQIVVAANRAKDLVKQILTFSRQDKQEKVPLNIRVVIKETLKLIRAALPSNIEIKQNLGVGDDLILADPTSIHQLIMNLCTNAQHAMADKGGILSCTLQKVDDIAKDDKKISLHNSTGPYLKLSITDTGCGIPEAIIDRIFEPYFTTKGENQGTGLGLAIVHSIVTDAGGQIFVRSKIGKGTTFDIYFPILHGKEKLSLDNKDEVLLKGSEHILLVDDEPAIIDVVKVLLKNNGYQVTSFTNSEKALAFFEKDINRFDLIITDMTMPRMNGIELVKKIKNLQPNIPIIICTGFSDKIDKSIKKKIGVSHLIAKPFTEKKLIQTIRKSLDNSHVG